MNLSIAQRVVGEVNRSAVLSGVAAREETRTLRFWDQVAFWASIGIGLGAMAPGAFLMPNHSLRTIVATAGIAAAVGGLALAAAAASGSSRGKPLPEAFVGAVGRPGAGLIALLLVLRNVVWAAYLIAFAADGAAYIFEPLAADTRAVWAALFAALGAGIAVVGPHVALPWLVKRLLAPVGLLMVLIVTLSSFAEMRIPDLMTRSPIGGWPNRWQGADLIVLGVVAWLPIAADFSRFSAKGEGPARAAFIGFAPTMFFLAVVGAVYLPVVSSSEAWQLLSAVPVGAMAFLMLLVFEADGITALTYASGSVAQWVTRERIVTTVAAAGAAAAVAIAWTTEELEPVALAAGLLFLPLIVLDPIDRWLAPRLRTPRFFRGLFLLAVWLGAFAVGSWFYPGLGGPWYDLVRRATSEAGVPFPLTHEFGFFGAFAPTVLVAAVGYPILLVIFRRKAKD